ncbi:MAG: DUF2520 domain-containing protein [Acidobacteria bacterium]|nr:DUF2520 domain-containing protein [Acidobacteriota bacterium]MCB9398320.1 DUF2520 domain-containing protein [Acidobacteriota bacterium]
MSDPWLLVGMGRLGSALYASLQAIPVECQIDPPARHKSWPASWADRSVLLCLPDDVLHQVAKWPMPKHGLPKHLVFCSGATPVNLFQDLAKKGVLVGKLHPLCSFPSRDPQAFPPGLTFALNGPAELIGELSRWVHLWQGEVLHLEDVCAAQYHLSAVLASNFLGLLVREGAFLLEGLVQDRQSALHALAPLVRQSLAAALDPNMEKPFSGPAARGDHQQIARHFALLQERDPELAQLYQTLSARILQRMSMSP